MTTAPETHPGSHDEAAAAPVDWQNKVAGTLINPATLLATDYLNHFNEVVMLIGMVPDMPDMLDDVRGWTLKTYPEHFRASGLTYGDLAAEAYTHAPAPLRAAFETTVDQLAAVITATIARLDAALAAGDPEAVRAIAAVGTTTLHTLIAQLSGIIAGSGATLAQTQIDQMMETP